MDPVDSKHLHLGKADLITLVVVVAIVLVLNGVLLVVLF
jgi:hypothetical protein